MPQLADQWRLLAPDFPGCGYSDTPNDFRSTFAGYADVLYAFLTKLGVQRCVVWLHDFGSQSGLRLAISHPELIAGLIIQNGDIYEDQLVHPDRPRRAALADLRDARAERSRRA